MAKQYTRKELMDRVQTAIGELHLSSMTNADKKRLHYVEQGLYALDEEQALIKHGVEVLLEEFRKTDPKTLIVVMLAKLVEGLQKLVAEPLPRVNYPDRKMLETPKRREIPLKGPAPSKSTVKQLASVQKNLGKIPRKTKIVVKG